MKELVVEVEMAPDGTPRLEAALGRLSRHAAGDLEAVRHPRVDDQRMSEVVEHVKLALLLATATASCFRSVIISGCPSPTLLVVMLEAIKHNAVLQSCTLDLGDTSISDQTGLALAVAIRHNAMLQSCTLGLGDTSISDQTGAAP
ncbi:unnamed protein product [Polarella glacialis]|uniref:Uncharacterized protein n=1 Tax=Polarella glacialis TaxID=89957 RepID=A0A813GG46_POLGL|nr:unnamed protein product [Polarella glacialis]